MPSRKTRWRRSEGRKIRRWSFQLIFPLQANSCVALQNPPYRIHQSTVRDFFERIEADPFAVAPTGSIPTGENREVFGVRRAFTHVNLCCQFTKLAVQRTSCACEFRRLKSARLLPRTLRHEPKVDCAVLRRR